MGNRFLKHFQGVLTPEKNDNSITSDSGPCPSLTEHEYKPRFFDEPDWMNSDKENMPPTESVTPPSLRNLSLEEEANEPENKATSWEASVVRNVETIPRASSPYPRKMSTLEDLDIADYSERPFNDKRSPRPKQMDSTQGHCPTPQNSSMYLAMNAVAVAPAKPYRTEVWGIPLDKRKVPCGWPAYLRRQQPRVDFKNNDICMVNDEEPSNYEEPRERHPKVQYKLRVCKNPTAKNMPHDDNNYESIDETAV